MAGGHAYRPEHALARLMLDAAAGPRLRPPLAQAMNALAINCSALRSARPLLRRAGIRCVDLPAP